MGSCESFSQRAGGQKGENEPYRPTTSEEYEKALMQMMGVWERDRNTSLRSYMREGGKEERVGRGIGAGGERGTCSLGGGI